MPTISMFYGILVQMYFYDDNEHHKPHIHVKYQGEEVILEIPTGNVLSGSIKANKLKLVQAWVEIHQEDLMVDWDLAVNGSPVFNIDPLR